MSKVLTEQELISLTWLTEYISQLDSFEQFPIVYGQPPNHEHEVSGKLLPIDHSFTTFVLELVDREDVRQILESLSNRFAAEGKFVKPVQVNLGVVESGVKLNSPYVMIDKEKYTRVIYLTTGFLYHLRRLLHEVRPGSRLKKGHIMSVFLHEYFHPGKFSGHPEEYNADRAAVIAMVELGYDPQEYIELMRAFALYEEKKGGPRFSSSHPFFHSMDIPADLTDVITTIILEERNKKKEAEYFAAYESSAQQRVISFKTPDVIASGQYMIMVEPIEGKVLADSERYESEILNILLAAFHDLQTGLINLDDHLGNFIRREHVLTGHQLASIDGGVTIDLRHSPELHLVVKN